MPQRNTRTNDVLQRIDYLLASDEGGEILRHTIAGMQSIPVVNNVDMKLDKVSYEGRPLLLQLIVIVQRR